MGTDGLGARVRIRRLAADRGRGRLVLFVVSIGLLPALAGCSSFSSSSASSNAAGPPNNSSTIAGQSAAPSGYSPAVATATAPPSAPAYTPSAPAAAPDFGPGFANVNATVSAPLTEDTGPSGLLVALFKSNSAPPAQTPAVPSPPSTYAPSAPVAAPDFGPGFANVNATVSAPPTEDTGPSGLLVALFKSNSTPPAGSANMPHPPSTYTASAPPYTPPPAQPAAPAPPPTSSAQ
jgi:hypothetical protein